MTRTGIYWIASYLAGGRYNRTWIPSEYSAGMIYTTNKKKVVKDLLIIILVRCTIRGSA
jgi:hypothetical protein